mgnify:CR=1 FL=1
MRILKKTVKNVFESVPYYKKRFNELKILEQHNKKLDLIGFVQ